MASLKVLGFATGVAMALAACPNQCSGHGRCGEFDKCICYKQQGLGSPYKYSYTGVDCSLRTCPFGRAYDDLATDSAHLTPITFKAASQYSTEKLRIFYTPGNRSTSFVANKRDQKFVVRIMTSDSFTWKYEEDEYFEPESRISDATGETNARHLGKIDSTGNSIASGVYVWWDSQYRGTYGLVDANGNSQVNAGDLYSFTLTYNEGVDFTPTDANSAHQEKECSGRGMCDTSSGKCQCFAGFTGEACQRTECPKNCNGHGSCQSEARFVADAKVNGAGVKYDAYDATQQYGCKCDAGYRGADCSQTECPSGEDPMGGPGGAEGLDCSGRGTCDYTSGICKCFKGFYGERCESQTNFV